MRSRPLALSGRSLGGLARRRTARRCASELSGRGHMPILAAAPSLFFQSRLRDMAGNPSDSRLLIQGRGMTGDPLVCGRRGWLLVMAAKCIFAALSAVFLALAAFRIAWDHALITPASRTWLSIGIIFALVSGYLWMVA